MSFPYLFRKLFQNDGGGEKLKKEILPDQTAIIDADGKLHPASTPAMDRPVVIDSLVSVAKGGIESYGDITCFHDTKSFPNDPEGGKICLHKGVDGSVGAYLDTTADFWRVSPAGWKDSMEGTFTTLQLGLTTGELTVGEQTVDRITDVQTIKNTGTTNLGYAFNTTNTVIRYYSGYQICTGFLYVKNITTGTPQLFGFNFPLPFIDIPTCAFSACATASTERTGGLEQITTTSCAAYTTQPFRGTEYPGWLNLIAVGRWK